MKLETADRDYDSIDDYTIAEAVNAVAELKTDFAVLTLEDGSFMQTAGGTAGMVLEYQDAESGEQFQVQGEDLAAGDVIAAFESFASGDGVFKTTADWQPIERPAASGCGSAVILLAVMTGLVYLLN